MQSTESYAVNIFKFPFRQLLVDDLNFSQKNSWIRPCRYYNRLKREIFKSSIFYTHSRYNWSDPLVAVFNLRGDRSQTFDRVPGLLESSLHNTLIKCYHTEKKTTCLELFQLVMLHSVNVSCFFFQFVWKIDYCKCCIDCGLKSNSFK
mgnify:FL=1